MLTNRREFLTAGAAAICASGSLAAAAVAEEKPQPTGLERQIGITMSSVSRLANDKGKLNYTIFDWIKMVREDLDMTVIDLNSGAVTSLEPAYLEKVRAAAADAGVHLTNMKINRGDVNIGSADPETRKIAIAECKRWIDGSAKLGLRWARPLPFKEKPDWDTYVSAYQELCDYANERNVQMLLENYGWISADADTAPNLIKAIGRNIAPCPDTGNWDSKELRYEGLAKMFPGAVSCDFKAGKLGPQGEHPPYDLKRCFTIGWESGFRGPWCLEHAHTDQKTLFGELSMLRDMLRTWMAEQSS